MRASTLWLNSVEQILIGCCRSDAQLAATVSVPLGRVHTKSSDMLPSLHGNHRSSVRTHRTAPPCAARATKVSVSNRQVLKRLRHPVRRRTGLRTQMAGVAGPFRQMAHHLHPDEPVVEEWRARPGLRTPPTGTDRAHQARSGFDGQHHRQGPPRRHGRAKKTDLSLLASPGAAGPPRLLHMVAADARTAVTFSLSPGQAHDAPDPLAQGASCSRAWGRKTKTSPC